MRKLPPPESINRNARQQQSEADKAVFRIAVERISHHAPAYRDEGRGGERVSGHAVECVAAFATRRPPAKDKDGGRGQSKKKKSTETT